jgi:acyl-coenzyme A thioesterase PaaI-like protein
VAPSPVSLEPGEALGFAASGSAASSQPGDLRWTVEESGGGTVDAVGNYMTPDAEGSFHVLASSSSDARGKAQAPVQVRWRGIRVRVTPRDTTLSTGQSATFSAIVRGTRRSQSTAVTWSIQEGAKGGSIDASGNYTAPGAPGAFHVVAASVADPTKTAMATVTVTADQGISVAVTPKNASVKAKGNLSFKATVAGTKSGQNTAVTWSIQEGASAGSVDASGNYTAPANPGTTHVVATSVADPSKTAVATVAVTAAPTVAVSVSPATASVVAGEQTSFSAAVTGTDSGQSTAVTWSVQEGASGGSVDGSGRYTAPGSPGTFHVVATSVADTSKSGQATVTVTAAPNVTVSVAPASASAVAGGTVSFSASVTGLGNGQSNAVSWSIQEGFSGGTINGAGTYTAPSSAGTFHVIATSVADNNEFAAATVTVTAPPAPPPPAPPPAPPSGLLPPDRMTTWNPGVSGGIPARTTVCKTVSPPGGDATSTIQAAVDACPAGQVVQLSAGTFTINGGNYVLINKSITLRGAGPGQTTLQKTDGAKPGQEATGANPSPLVIVGPARWDSNNEHSTNLTADAAKGANSITVASASGFSPGQIVLLDELSGASWQQDPAGRGQIWASSDFRVVYQRHNPSQGTDDPFPDAAGWFSRQDRPTNEIKQIDHIDGSTVFFNTPIHISYRASHTAQLTAFSYPHTQNAGVENLSVIGGDQGNIRFEWAANSWAKNIENSVWHDEGFALTRSFRIEIRESYVHDAAWAQPGGAGYAISLSDATSESLIENSIIVKANKVMVARSSGAGSVFGYNYVDDGYINTNTSWIEVGLNASHMVGPHHVLFEGNYGFNFDSDKTHGNAIYHTIFRNHLSGTRRDFGDNGSNNNGPKRAAGAAYYSYWHSFVGNVLGVAGQMNGWVYESGNMDQPAIFLLGWDDWAPYPTDPQVAATTIRHGNFDYVTNSVKWDPSLSQSLPSSLYLGGKPAFFNAGSGYTWPWVDPTGATKLYTLPAKARFDNGTPFVQP